jgi:hypothetical protein
VEGIYTKSLQNFFYDTINLPDAALRTDTHGRLMYGNIVGNNINPAYKKLGVGDVWGAQDLGSTNSQSILTRASLNGQDGVYRFNPSFSQFNTTNMSSNYAMQLQLKYTF